MAQESDAVEAPDLWWRWSMVALAMVIATIAVTAVGVGLSDPPEDARAVIALVGESLLGVVTLWAGARAAGDVGTFLTRVGLVRPNFSDLGTWLRGVGYQFVAVLVFGVVIVKLAPHAAKNASNTTGLHHASITAVVIEAVAAVVIAPLVEEVLFRGFLLTAGTARFGFGSSAIGSSIVFGLLHGWQVDNVGGSIVLVLRLIIFGLVQCVLVRDSRRLNGNVLVHATSNLVAVVLASQ